MRNQDGNQNCGVAVALLIFMSVACGMYMKRTYVTAPPTAELGTIHYENDNFLQQEWKLALLQMNAGYVKDGIDRRKLGKEAFEFLPPLTQEQLAKIYAYDPATVNFRAMGGQFQCGTSDTLALGCFYPTVDGPHIFYVAEINGTVIHEAAHLLLWEIGDPRWWCVLHDYNYDGKWDCYE